MSKTKSAQKATLEKKLILKEILAPKIQNFESLFASLEFGSFSHSISLQEYQIAALKSAIAALSLYTQSPDSLYQSYLECELEDITKEQINTASFWMATGSGKSIVMIKFIALLHDLFALKTLPAKPIMLLVPNDKILEQFKAHIKEYNAYQSKTIAYKDLKDYESVSYGASLFDENIVFIGRSDLLDTSENVGKDSRAKRLNYKNFLGDEGWIVLLDEAHKGDSKDSVRKGYIRELAEGNGESNKGFIFNFSATFSDNFDLQTCAFNYNLERFNLQGYGKNIAVLDSDLKSFRDKEKNEEQIVKILESFILFCAIKKHREFIIKTFDSIQRDKPLIYHQPLIIAVADKVNTQDAGIKLYFEAILQILKEDRDITSLAQNLYENLSQNQNLYFDKNLSLDEEFLGVILTMDSKTLRKEIFYAKEASMIEACRIKGNAKEIVFKSKNAKEPFLLLNIGSIREWEKQYLQHLGVESGEDITSGYFQSINEEASPIQIMIGSKVFSEGWDSNRVNMISFINIGSKNAKKYVLQTIGRGVRIEPFKGVRKRLGQCEKELDFNMRGDLRNKALGIETLFIMATQTEAIKGILEGLEEFIQSYPLSGFRKSKAFKPLLVPKYKDSTSLQNKPYILSHCDFEELKSYIESFDEDVLLLSENIRAKDLGYKTLCKIKEKITNESETKTIEISGDMPILKAENALRVLESFFSSKSKELDKFEEIKDEICHFKKFSSTLDFSIVEEINAKIRKVVETKIETRENLESNNIPKEYIEKFLHLQQNEKRAEVCGYVLDSTLQEHYYNPLILDEKQDGRIVYAIKEKSEVEFLRELQKYVKDKDNALKNYEWCFSKIVENVDSIYIPYFDSQNQAYRKFYPDFIFWLRHKQSKEYKIIFIDPKGLTHEVNARDKAQGFESIFGKNGSSIGGNKTFLYYFNKQNILDSSLKIYTQSTIAEIFYL